MPNATPPTLAVRRTLPEVTALGALFSLFVVFIHVSSAPVTAFFEGRLIWGVVYVPWQLLSINVRSFIFLSGLKLFHNGTTHMDYRRFYRSRLMKIVLPYLLWNVLYYLYFVYRQYFSFSAMELLRYIATGTLVSPFYFVIIVLQFYALAPLWMALFKKVHPLLILAPAAVLTLLLSQHLPGIIAFFRPGYAYPFTDRTFTSYLFFWAAGCYMGLHYDRAIRLLRDNRVFITVSFIVLAVVEASVGFISRSGIRPVGWFEPVHYLYTMAAIAFFLTAAAGLFEKRPLRSRFVALLSKSGYIIFLMHSLVIFHVDYLMQLGGVTRMSVTYVIRIAVVYTFTLGAAFLWTLLKEKIKRRKKRAAPPAKP